MKCVRCFRPLKNAPSPHGMGPTCERAMYGTKPKPRLFDIRRKSADERTPDMFAEVRA